MLTEDEARRQILASVSPLKIKEVPLLDALGRFAARMLTAAHALPAFDNSAMDGYAVAVDERLGKLPAGTRLRVGGEQPAGLDRGLRVEPGGAVRIFTGAPVPAKTGAVVMQEDVERTGDEIVLKETVAHGEFVRRAGGDLARGQRILAVGERLTAGRLALLASQGLSQVAVHRRPRVAVLATGDELRAPGEPLGPGEIYESNGVLLAALATAAGAAVTVLPRARDDRADLDAKLSRGLDAHDALVIAGGASVGERDFVKERLAAAGVALDLWRVRVRPGKPFLHGRAASAAGAHVFGLPGNPVSAFVTFLLFVRPALLRMAGAAGAGCCGRCAGPGSSAITGAAALVARCRCAEAPTKKHPAGPQLWCLRSLHRRQALSQPLTPSYSWHIKLSQCLLRTSRQANDPSSSWQSCICCHPSAQQCCSGTAGDRGPPSALPAAGLAMRLWAAAGDSIAHLLASAAAQDRPAPAAAPMSPWDLPAPGGASGLARSCACHPAHPHCQLGTSVQ